MDDDMAELPILRVSNHAKELRAVIAGRRHCLILVRLNDRVTVSGRVLSAFPKLSVYRLLALIVAGVSCVNYRYFVWAVS